MLYEKCYLRYIGIKVSEREMSWTTFIFVIVNALTKLKRNYAYMRHDGEGNKKCGQGDTHEYEDCRANKYKDKYE